ncbi:MAG TPA: L-seryl-tRNA(Sec) selenium transferase, partial [Candidatus Angelobacter sp.]|nr:L-seryl-tRNA(Sec) selenium transferase [Candidatus Angelobacter sp.]
MLPSVDELTHSPELSDLLEREGQPALTDAVRTVLAEMREEISSGNLASTEAVEMAVAGLPDAVARQLRAAMD